MELVVSKCWGIWHNRDPPAEHEKTFKRLREKVRSAAVGLLLPSTLGTQTRTRGSSYRSNSPTTRMCAQASKYAWLEVANTTWWVGVSFLLRVEKVGRYLTFPRMLRASLRLEEFLSLGAAHAGSHPRVRGHG